MHSLTNKVAGDCNALLFEAKLHSTGITPVRLNRNSRCKSVVSAVLKKLLAHSVVLKKKEKEVVQLRRKFFKNTILLSKSKMNAFKNKSLDLTVNM